MANEKSKQKEKEVAKDIERTQIQDTVTVIEKAAPKQTKAKMQLKRCAGNLTAGWIAAVHEEPRQPQDVVGMIHTVKTRTTEETFYSFKEEEFVKLAVLLGLSM